jgi:hypothetical protein
MAINNASEAAEIATLSEGVGGEGVESFNPRDALKSAGLSILINGLMPFAIYKLLVPHFAAASLTPLLAACAFPLLGLAFGLLRTRTVDAIAMIALFGITYSIVSILLATNVRWALIMGSTQGFLIAAAFFVSAAIGRPLLFYVARQFTTGADAGRQKRFAEVNEADGGRTFFTATMVWAVASFFLAGTNLWLAATLPPATYIVAVNVLNTSINIVLIAWTIRYIRTRLVRVAARIGVVPLQS